jgi:hypothetical protein
MATHRMKKQQRNPLYLVLILILCVVLVILYMILLNNSSSSEEFILHDTQQNIRSLSSSTIQTTTADKVIPDASVVIVHQNEQRHIELPVVIHHEPQTIIQQKQQQLIEDQQKSISMQFTQSGILFSDAREMTLGNLFHNINDIIKSSEIPYTPMLTTDMRYYFNDAHVSIQRTMLYMNILRTFMWRRADRSYRQIIEHHHYNGDRLRSRPELSSRDYEPDYTTVRKLLCLFQQEKKTVFTTTSISLVGYSSSTSAGYLHCRIPQAVLSQIENHVLTHMVLVEVKGPLTAHTVISDKLKVNRILGKFKLLHPLQKLNIDPKYIESKSTDQPPILIAMSVAPLNIDKINHLVQFIEYHRFIGIEHFIIYISERSAEEYIKFEKLLGYYVSEKLVTIVKWVFGIIEYVNNLQVPAIMDSNFRIMDYIQWFAILDTDEYLIPARGDSIVPVIKEYSQQSKQRVIELQVRNVLFSTYQGDIPSEEQEGNLLEKYIFKDRVWRMNIRSKYIARVGQIVLPSDVHTILLTFNSKESRKAVLDPEKEMYMAHYYYSQRERRGDENAVRIKNKDTSIRDRFSTILSERVKIAEQHIEEYKHRTFDVK